MIFVADKSSSETEGKNLHHLCLVKSWRFHRKAPNQTNRRRGGDVQLQRIQPNHLKCLISLSTPCIQQTEWCQSLRVSVLWIQVGIASLNIFQPHYSCLWLDIQKAVWYKCAILVLATEERHSWVLHKKARKLLNNDSVWWMSAICIGPFSCLVFLLFINIMAQIQTLSYKKDQEKT